MFLFDWLKFTAILLVVAWVAGVVVYYFVLEEEKKRSFRENFCDPKDCPRLIWGWFKDAFLALKKQFVAWQNTDAPPVPVMDEALVETLVDVRKELTFVALRELTETKRTESDMFYLASADALLGHIRTEVMYKASDVERFARLIILIDMAAGIRGYDLDAAIREMVK